MVLSWFANRVNPIAVDVGTDTIKLLQAEPTKASSGNDPQFRLIAADCQMIPDDIRANAAERDDFVAEAIRKMLTEGFRGKQVVTCLPSNRMAVQHLKMAKMPTEEFNKALPFEAAGKLPFDANRAVLRHTIAGEVYQNQEAKQEVILMAAPREAVDRHLKLLAQAKAEVVGVHVEPNALIECFGHVFRRKEGETVSTIIIDMGASATHVVIAYGTSLAFAKHIAIGGDLFNKRVAEAVKCRLPAAKELRVKVAHQQSQAVEPATVEKVQSSLTQPLDSLVFELQGCMRYYASIFPGRNVDRAIFVGGESRHVALCQSIAQRLGVPATLGDPLARLSKENVAQNTVDLRHPQPGWAIAVGLGIGLATPASE
ncbi:MAG: pilus assembly protein PilM [Phycisphaerales bacterium]|nr:pilus assembly protein PilM [Phycisphaerales bacterium]